MRQINRAFSGGKAKVSAATVSQDSEDAGPSSRPSAGMLDCNGRVVIFRPTEISSLCFWMCSGHTELGCPLIWLAISDRPIFCILCNLWDQCNVLIHRSDQCRHCRVETFCRCSRCIDCRPLVFYLSHFLRRSSTAPTCLFACDDVAS